jgi:hypothetical protein
VLKRLLRRRLARTGGCQKLRHVRRQHKRAAQSTKMTPEQIPAAHSTRWTAGEFLFCLSRRNTNCNYETVSGNGVKRTFERTEHQTLQSRACLRCRQRERCHVGAAVAQMALRATDHTDNVWDPVCCQSRRYSSAAISDLPKSFLSDSPQPTQGHTSAAIGSRNTRGRIMSWLSDRAFGLRDAPLFRPRLEGGAK